MPQTKAKHAVVRTGGAARRGKESAVAPGGAADVAASRGVAAASRGVTATRSAAPRAVAVAPRAVAVAPRAASAAPHGDSAASPAMLAGSGAEVAASRCEAELLRVLRLAGLLVQDTSEANADVQSSESAARLLAALEGLEPEMALKLQMLLISGREGKSIGTQVTPALSSDVAGIASLTVASDKDGPGLIDDLRRGQAIACAMDIDVDSPLADWRSLPAPDLGERAWLSFGKQLARSNPEDWQAFGVPARPAQGFSKLYLKLGEGAWWSFQTTLDRPTLAGVAKERRALAKRRVKGVSVQTLQALVGQLGHARGRALRRASRAIRARVGSLGPVLAPPALAPLRK